jgi:hypothetical protein
MRWKLIIAASSLATMMSAGVDALLLFLSSDSASPGRDKWFELSFLVFPLLTTLWAAIFIYRHTARWRKWQALLTCLLSALWMAIILLAYLRFLG